MRKFLVAIGIGTLFLFINSPLSAQQSNGPSLTPPVERIIRGLVTNDVTSYLKGEDALVEWQPGIRASVTIDAQVLAKRYRENEIAGDKLIKDKPVVISGRLIAVRWDHFTHQPVVQLDSGGLFPVQVGMTDDSVNIAATYKTDQAVQLLCEKGGHKLVVAIRLNDCRDFAAVRDPIALEAKKKVLDWLNTGTIPPYQTTNKTDGGTNWREGFFLMYWLAANLPTDSKCVKPSLMDEQAAQCFAKTVSHKLKPEEADQFRGSYQAEQSFLHLPPADDKVDKVFAEPQAHK